MNDTLRIATWNIMFDENSRTERLTSVANALINAKCDIVTIQEAWAGAPDDLAGMLGMRVASASTFETPTGALLFNAILTRHPVLEAGTVTLEGANSNRAAATSLIGTPGGRLWRVITTHLAWGSHAEGERLTQARRLDHYAARHESPDLTTVLTGDFNATPQSATLRYLTGLDPDPLGRSTYWADAWTAGIGNGITSDPQNPHAATTAARVGITRPELLPSRRIDYILTRGYAHGRPGSPLAAAIIGQYPTPLVPSDHYGVIADLWNPAVHSNA